MFILATVSMVWTDHAAGAEPSLAQHQQTAQASGAVSELEIARWKSIGNSSNVSDYEAYLKKFGPDGAFARLARSRIEDLRARTPAAAKLTEGDQYQADLAAARAAIKRAEDFVQGLAGDSAGLMGGMSSKVPLSKQLDIFRGFLGAVVDLRTMARYVLGRHAKRLSDTEFKKFLRYYEALFLKGYTYTRGDVWDGKIELKGVRPYSKDYLVTLTLRPRKGGSEEVGLRLRRDTGSFFGFKVIDVLYKGISLLVTQRGDYSSVLNDTGVAGLIGKIEQKVGYQEEIIEIK